MLDDSLRFLKNLLQTPSPSGFERPVQDVVRARAEPYADEVRTDRHGNVIAAAHPDGQPRIMLAGHCDQIGLMVQHIDDNGFLYVQPIGGWDMQILLGQNLTVWTQSGPVAGLVARRATHLLTADERNKVPQFTDIWIDIGVKDKAEAERLVKPGDPVTLELGYRELRNNLASSPGMDDKVGVWAVMETLRLLQGRPLQASVFCVSTVQEEIGLRGATTSAYGIHPAIGIAVDVCHATDTPGNDKKQVGDVARGCRSRSFSRPQHQSPSLRRFAERGPDARDPRASSWLPARYGNRRQRDAAQPRWRRDRSDRHPESLHAQSGGSRQFGRFGAHGPIACRILRSCHSADGMDSLSKPLSGKRVTSRLLPLTGWSV